MLRNTLISCGALAIAGTAHAGLVTMDMQGSGLATGSLAPLGLVTMTLSISVDDAASSISPNTAFGAWSYTVRNASSQVVFAASGNAAIGTSSTYLRYTNGSVSTRKYTVVLGGTTSSGWQGSGVGLPAITMVEIGYVAARTGSAYGTVSESLTQSAAGNGGFLMAVANGSPTGFGTLGTNSFTFVPAPGAAALLSVAGLVSQRRRRA